MKIQKQLISFGIATLVVGTLSLSSAVGAGKQVTRPFKIRGEVTMVVNTSSGMVTFLDLGVATHEGQITNPGEAQVDPSGVTLWATGTAITANGDKVFWRIDGASPHTVVFINGTGRFEGVTGGFLMESSPRVITPGPSPGTVTVTFTYTGIGTITY